MVIRLIGTIVAIIIMAFFVGFNLENKCDVSLLFATFKDVPVFITIMLSFAVGILFTLPVALSIRFKKNKKEEKKDSPKEKKHRFSKKSRTEEKALAAQQHADSASGGKTADSSGESAGRAEPESESETGSAI